ncbi:MAG: LOG family protein [Anaerolineales bacterium]|nr:LOG family protein [Anaerolineales bacterium]
MTSIPVISVFGSSAPRPGSVDYEQARRVGRLLAEAGAAVATGGYGGTMLAVSHGAAEAGGHVIGVTSAQIEQFRPGGANAYVAEVVHYPTLRERLLHLVTQNDGMIVLPGGIGTLSEMTLAWSFLQVGEVPPRPLVLLGAMWRETVTAVLGGGYVPEKHAQLLRFAEAPETAVRLALT